MDLRALVDTTLAAAEHVMNQMPDVFEFQATRLESTMPMCNEHGKPQPLRGRPLPIKYGVRFVATATTARVATFITGEFINHSLLAEWKIMDIFHEAIGGLVKGAHAEIALKKGSRS